MYIKLHTLWFIKELVVSSVCFVSAIVSLTVKFPKDLLSSGSKWISLRTTLSLYFCTFFCTDLTFWLIWLVILTRSCWLISCNLIYCFQFGISRFSSSTSSILSMSLFWLAFLFSSLASWSIFSKFFSITRYSVWTNTF